ncbi:MAG: hypothetical protein HY606_11960 [Planctomycetes bacterium]|nr:hypothetical protein [Planctomycetota bacterium]
MFPDKDDEKILGPVTIFGVKYSLARRWDREEGEYKYAALTKNNRIALNKNTGNDWRDNVLRHLPTAVIETLSKLDNEAGFKEMELFRKRESKNKQEKEPQQDTATLPTSPQTQHPQQAALTKKYIGEIDLNGRHKFYGAEENTDIYFLEEEGSKNNQKLTRQVTARGADWLDSEHTPISAALSYKLEIALKQGGIIKEITIASSAQMGARPIRRVNDATFNRLQRGPYRPEGIRVEEDADESLLEAGKGSVISFPKLSSGDKKPEIPTPKNVTDSVGATDKKRASSVTRPAKKDSDLNRQMLYIFPADSMDFVRQVKEEFARSGLREKLRERCEEYETFLNSGQFDEVLRYLSASPIADKIQEDVESIERKKPKGTYKPDSLHVLIPAAMEENNFLVVLPLNSDEDYKSLERELFEHSMAALAKIGTPKINKEGEVTVLEIRNARTKDISKVVDDMLKIPQALQAANIELYFNVNYSAGVRQQHGRRKGATASSNEIPFTLQVLLYAVGEEEFSAKDIKKFSGKTMNQVSGTLSNLKKAGRLDYVGGSTYRITGEGRRYAEEHGPEKGSSKTSSSLSTSILEYGNQRNSFTLADAAVHINRPQNATSSIINYTMKKGYLRRIERGTYEITAKGKKRLATL